MYGDSLLAATRSISYWLCRHLNAFLLHFSGFRRRVHLPGGWEVLREDSFRRTLYLPAQADDMQEDLYLPSMTAIGRRQ